ncbi:MFS transporter [Yinghuangia soli]|uniref:MFS transporter n=1 Tax=Yinghuangia soli TaxID=2908204 RepID=A0AA41U3G8_9ACTN|nr:MFS transporter [Yinghuangia soli]MCF2532738.1 MFS transporter [Yinghuangia soli]
MQKRFALWSYLGGVLAARTGNEMSGPALLLAGLAATGSAASASALLAGLTISAAVGGPLFGVLLDRSARPGRLLAAAIASYAAALGVIVACLGKLPIPFVVLIAVLGGLVGPALSGGWTAQMPLLVDAKTMPRATAYDAMTYNFSSLVGPALAALVVGLSGGPVGVAAAVGLICCSLPRAWTLPSRTKSAEQPHTSVAADLGVGFRAIFGTRLLARATIASVIVCAAEGMLIACTPLLGEQSLGSAENGALLLSVVAAAALAANAALARRPHWMRPDTVIWVSDLVLAGALLLCAVGGVGWLIAAAVLVGIGEGPQMTALFAIRHREAPERLRGQVFTTGASLKITGFALGAALAGPIATWSLRGALITSAALSLTAAAAFAIATKTRRPSRPVPIRTG